MESYCGRSGIQALNPTFGVKALVEKEGTYGDMTEIDMAFSDDFVEAKLTEEDFTERDY
ncbi:MAG TPA: hypothetical protein VHO90_18995 [Bacteroidales bacterium]|nr:hypothetical protein [Bacteroidales bacterium]